MAEADVQVLGAAHRDELLVRELGVSLVGVRARVGVRVRVRTRVKGER